MINFSRPLFLFLLLMFPIYFILLKQKIFKQNKMKLSILNWNTTKVQKKIHINILYNIAKLAGILGVILLILVIAGPVKFESKKVFSDSGHSIMFIVDVSPSMAANDMNGETRLNTAKKVIKTFVEKNEEHLFGLTALGSNAAMLIPPTMDHNTFINRLNNLQAGELGPGSAIGMGIATATVHTVSTEGNKSYIVLLTDGENNTGEIHPEVAAKVARKRGIHVYVIGLGKTGYAEVEYTNPETKEKITGTMHTEFHETKLKKISTIGNGHYNFASTPEELIKSFKKLASEIPPSSSSFNITVEKNLDCFLLKIVLLLLSITWIIKKLILGARI